MPVTDKQLADFREQLGKARRYQLAGTRKTLKAAKSAALKAWRRWVAEAGLEAKP